MQNDPLSNDQAGRRTFRRVVILGHTGLIGIPLMRRFQEQSGQCEVVGFSAPSLDLTREEQVRSLASLFDAETAVLMLAAVKRQFGDNLEAFLYNLKMVTNLCALLQEHPVARLVFFSSAAVYGEDVHNLQISEETPVHPTSYYGLVKYTAERLLWKVLGHLPHCPLLIVRPPLIYGPGDRAGTYGPSGFIRAALKAESITLWGDGTERREFLFVEDAVELVRQLMLQEFSGVVNLVSGCSYTFKQALEFAGQLSGAALTVSSRPRTKAKVDNAFDNARLRSLLPEVSFTPLDEGIRRTLETESRQLASQRAEPAGVAR